MSTSQARAARGTDASNSIFFLVSQLIAVNLPKLGSFQRLKHIADQIPLSSSFQVLAADPLSLPEIIFARSDDAAPTGRA